MPVQPEIMAEMLKSVDLDGDGRISFQEFVKWMVYIWKESTHQEHLLLGTAHQIPPTSLDQEHWQYAHYYHDPTPCLVSQLVKFLPINPHITRSGAYFV